MRTAPNKIELYLDEKVFLKKNFRSLTAKQLLEHINSSRINGDRLKLHTLRLKYYELGLYKSPRQEHWTARETRFLVNNYHKMGNKEICEHLNSYSTRSRTFNVKSIWKKMRLMKLVRTQKDLTRIRFQHIESGIWKKSQLICAAKKTYQQGKKVIRANGSQRKYWYIKHGYGMVAYHRYLWEQHNGSIPAGYKVYFKDGNQLNCRIDNLECLPAHGVKYYKALP